MAAAITHSADVIILSATPGGIAAAIAAARSGSSVLLLERTEHIGGLCANGLGATDIATRGATGGFFDTFTARIKAYYEKTYGANSEQVQVCTNGIHFEPSVAEKVLENLVSEWPAIQLLRLRQFDALPENVTKQGARVTGMTVLNRTNNTREQVHGKIFIDATYEGDLAAAAGAPFRIGREDQREFNEPMAGQIYMQWHGEIGAGSTGWGDNALQAYNYRLPLTNVAGNRVPVEKPAHYNRAEYASLVDDLKLNRHTCPANVSRHEELYWDGIGRVTNIVTVPNGKTDSNNQHTAFLSTDLPEENWPWPSAGWTWRDAYAARLREYTLGLLWFCQNDSELPEDFRQRCREWGFSRDEYADNGHFPRQVYVREGRRIVGENNFTAHDAVPIAQDKRPPVHATSVTASHYALDSHATRKREPDRVHLEGFFSMRAAPYTVPYGVIVPREVEGLLVPVAASATHIGFSTLRMEPCWMALGEAAGTAAALSLAQEIPVRTVKIAELQRSLLKRGAVLFYIRDVAPGHPHYEALQILGLRGLLPDWDARPDDPVTEADAAAWCHQLDLATDTSSLPASRGEYLQALYQRIPG